MANKNFWDLTFRIEPWLHRFLELYYGEEVHLTQTDEIGMLALAVIKIDPWHKRQFVERYEEQELIDFSIKVHYSYYRRINVKRYDANINYSISFNQAIKRIFHREYINYIRISAEQLQLTGQKVNFSELTRRFLLKYEVAEDDINMRSLRQVFDRQRRGRKMNTL